MILHTLQPAYHHPQAPDRAVAAFLIDQLARRPQGALTVLPEYSNAGGLSDPQAELEALPRAQELLAAARESACQKGGGVAVNVLERREGKIYNSTYLFDQRGDTVFVYDKIHLPPSEVALGVTPGTGACLCEWQGLRVGFLTCYDVYFNEQLEYLARHKPDLLLIPGYQRGERVDIIRAQAKLAAFGANAYLVRSSYSMNDELHGGCSMIVAPDGQILEDMGKAVGSVCREVDPTWKYRRPAGFGGQTVRNDDFIRAGCRPELFEK